MHRRPLPSFYSLPPKMAILAVFSPDALLNPDFSSRPPCSVLHKPLRYFLPSLIKRPRELSFLVRLSPVGTACSHIADLNRRLKPYNGFFSAQNPNRRTSLTFSILLFERQAFFLESFPIASTPPISTCPALLKPLSSSSPAEKSRKS